MLLHAVWYKCHIVICMLVMCYVSWTGGCVLQDPNLALQLLSKVTEVDPRDYDAFVRQAEIYMVRLFTSLL